MRVLQCIWKMGVGGTEGQILRLAPALVKQGIDLHMLTALEGTYDAALPVPLHRVEPWFKYDPTSFLRIAAFLRRLRPDVVHTFLTQMDIVAGVAAATLGIPWVLSEQCNVDAYPPILRHRLRVMAGRRADAIVANADIGADYWRAVAPDLERIRVIPNMVPFEQIDAAAPVDDEQSGDVVLFAARFVEQKNILNLLDALAPLLQNGRRAILCGDGHLRPQAEQRARDLGIEQRTRFPGNVSNVWSWMKRASVFVLPSAFEGQPNVVLEAAAAGTPLVLSDIPAHRALFNDDAVRFVDGASPESIRAGIAEVLNDRGSARARAERARRDIEPLSGERIAPLYEAVYREVLG